MHTDGNKNQEGQDSSFIQNGLEHYLFSPKKIVTVGFLFALIVAFIGIVSRTLSGYKLAVEEVRTVVLEHPTIIQMQGEIVNVKEEQKDHEARIRNLEAAKRR